MHTTAPGRCLSEITRLPCSAIALLCGVRGPGEAGFACYTPRHAAPPTPIYPPARAGPAAGGGWLPDSSDTAPPAAEPAPLLQVNTAVNRQGRPCPGDACLDDWPDVADLERLDAWDCKAYAVAKADRLIGQHGYDPARLEYVLVEGPPLRVSHAALLVDGRLGNGQRPALPGVRAGGLHRRSAHRRPAAGNRTALPAPSAAGGAGAVCKSLTRADCPRSFEMPLLPALPTLHSANGLLWFSGGMG